MYSTHLHSPNKLCAADRCCNEAMQSGERIRMDLIWHSGFVFRGRVCVVDKKIASESEKAVQCFLPTFVVVGK